MSEASGSLTLQNSSSQLRSSIEREKNVVPPEQWSLPPPEPCPLTGQDDDYDVGWDAWMTVIATWMIQFCTYGYVSAFGVYQDYYTRSFLNTESPSNISWIGSFQLFMQYAPGMLVGRAFDLGYCRSMISVGSGLQVISMFMLSLAHPHSFYEVFLAQAVGMGLGQALLFLPSLSILGQHFRRRRALAIGIATSGASVGGLTWPIMLNQLSQLTSFANAIRITAAITSLLLLVCNLILKTKPRRTDAQERPSIRLLFQDSPYIVSIASAFCISLGLFFPFFYLQLYAVDRGVDESLAFYAVTFLNAGSVFGRLLPNFFADRFGAYNMLLPCLFISSASVFAMLAINRLSEVIAFGILYGFWSGSYVSLVPSLLAQLSTNSGEHGTRMGLAFSIVGFSLLIGTPIEGALLRHRNTSGRFSWDLSIVFCGVIVLCGALAMTLSRYLYISQGRAGDRAWRV